MKLETVFLYMPLILNGAVFQFIISPDRNSLQPEQEHLQCVILQYLQKGQTFCTAWPGTFVVFHLQYLQNSLQPEREHLLVPVYNISSQELFTALTGTFTVFKYTISQDKNSLQPKQEHLLCTSLQYLQTGTLYSLNRNICCVPFTISPELFTAWKERLLCSTLQYLQTGALNCLKGTFSVFQFTISPDRNSLQP